MRTYFISSGLQGCYFVRCLLPLQANGWDGDQTTNIVDNSMKTPENKAYAAQQSDVVVFHRPDDPNKLKLARLLKKQGKKVVFDNDDTYKDDGGFKLNEYMDKERLEHGLAKINETIDAFIREADLVTTTTDYLADEYRKQNKNTVVLPNCVDPFYFDEPIRNRGEKVRIGITGSIGVTSDFDVAYDIITQTIDDPRIEWVVFSIPRNRDDKVMRELYKDEYEKLDRIKDRIDWHGFVDNELYFDYLNELALDMMVIPRADNLFNRCKSNLKFLEASMFEIPLIAQGFPDKMSPYQANPEDAKHMLVANNTDEFVEHINRLVDNRMERLQLGRKARKYVEKTYDINTNAHRWLDAYATMFKHD